jgi:hypothetical protein
MLIGWILNAQMGKTEHNLLQCKTDAWIVNTEHKNVLLSSMQIDAWKLNYFRSSKIPECVLAKWQKKAKHMSSMQRKRK